MVRESVVLSQNSLAWLSRQRDSAMLILVSCLIKIGDPLLRQVPFSGLSRLSYKAPANAVRGFLLKE